MSQITITMNSNKYQVALAADGQHRVYVVKQRNRSADYLSTIKPGSANWKRAVRLAQGLPKDATRVVGTGIKGRVFDTPSGRTDEYTDWYEKNVGVKR